MRLILMGVALAMVAGAVSAQSTNSVRGYIRRDGTYVAPHVRTNPNSTRMDNYSTAPNYNPYTGQQGTVQPYPVPVYKPYNAQPVRPYTPQPTPKCPAGSFLC